MSKRTINDGALNEMVFCIKGNFSCSRDEFETFIIANGGTVVGSANESITHIVSNEESENAEGVKIVNEQWVRESVSANSKIPRISSNGYKIRALEGICIAIMSTLSVPKLEFEALITEHGAKVVDSVTDRCTHVVSDEEFHQDDIKVVTEEWIRNLINISTFDGQKDHEQREFDYEPSHDYINELIATDEEEGRLQYNGEERNLDKILFSDDDNYDNPNKVLYKVIAYHKKEDGCFYTIQNLVTMETLEESINTLCDSYYTIAPLHVINRWERFQSKRIYEGIWSTEADDTLVQQMNVLVDELANNEPIDLHPGTKNIVRDLVHPSLYPLLIDPDSIDTTQENRWCRKYEKSRFQWLPAELSIDDDGICSFTSNINNLDSEKYSTLQTCLEKTFEALLPGFEQVWEYAQKATMTEEYNDSEGYEDIEPVSFKNSSLQVIVKIADYIFEPGASFNGVWHYEGMPHENIVMTGLFYPNSDDKLGGGLEFKRQFTDAETYILRCELPQRRPVWINKIIKTGFVPLGWTSTETGKLLVFPNCHAHRVLEMVNNTSETLRRRLIVFFVVDPDRRIPSSQDHPPMPRQVSFKQALQDRLELMQERKQAKEALNPRAIELCEH